MRQRSRWPRNGPRTQAPADAVKKLKSVKGFTKVYSKQLKRWREAVAEEKANGGKRKKHGGGPKVNSEFEQAVIDELIYTSLETGIGLTG